MAKDARPGDIICLDGDLGAGKTVFAKGFAAGLSISEVVNSPTFVIMQVYGGGRLELYHFDLYRIGDASQLCDIGYEDYFYGDGVCLVEWAALAEDVIPRYAVHVNISRDDGKGPDYRRIEISNVNGESGK